MMTKISENFGKRNCIGAEIEVGIVDSRGRKLAPPRTLENLNNCLEMMAREVKEFSEKTPHDTELLEYAESTQKITDLLKNYKGDDQTLDKILQDFYFSRPSGKKGFLDSLLDVYDHPHDQVEIQNTLTKKDTSNLKILLLAYSQINRLLPLYHAMTPFIPEKDKPFIEYDVDSIEFVTSPVGYVEQVGQQLLMRANIVKETAKKALGRRGRGMQLHFGDRYQEQPLGLGELFNANEGTDNLGLHVHIGRVQDLREAAHLYEFFRIVSPELAYLFCNLKQDSRLNVYGSQVPPTLGNLSISNGKLAEKMKEMFGVNSKFERRTGDDIDRIIAAIEGKSPGYFPRAGATVFVRPEFGTVEVRLLDTQKSDKQGATLEDHIQANVAAIDFVDAIAKMALDQYRKGQTLGKQAEDITPNYFFSYQLKHGEPHPIVLKNTNLLLSKVHPYLKGQTRSYLQPKIETLARAI